VIHTVGPVWRGGGHGEPALLASCYRSSLELAAQHGLGSVAFPAISCGIYGYPLADAARVAVRTVRAFLADHATPERVTFVAFDGAVASALERVLQEAS
jgi:O-acetyl-ADP-ribose deacetylase (regulator of RNase III)